MCRNILAIIVLIAKVKLYTGKIRLKNTFTLPFYHIVRHFLSSVARWSVYQDTNPPSVIL